MCHLGDIERVIIVVEHPWRCDDQRRRRVVLFVDFLFKHPRKFNIFVRKFEIFVRDVSRIFFGRKYFFVRFIEVYCPCHRRFQFCFGSELNFCTFVRFCSVGRVARFVFIFSCTSETVNQLIVWIECAFFPELQDNVKAITIIIATNFFIITNIGTKTIEECRAVNIRA